MSKKRTSFVFAASLGFAAGLLLTWLPARGAERFDHQVRNLFFAGFAGDAASLAKGLKICEDILAQEPDHAEALVWHGAGLFFQSGEAFRQQAPHAMDLYGRGIAEMNRAVKLAPNNVGVRVPRGAVLLTSARFVPAQQGQALLRDGISDFEAVLELQKESFARLGTHPRGELLFGLADSYSRTGNSGKAQYYFDRIAAELPNTVYARRAALWNETKQPLPPSQTGCVGCHEAGQR
jgi:tetratricopeptide (TPR) repeat protein